MRSDDRDREDFFDFKLLEEKAKLFAFVRIRKAEPCASFAKQRRARRAGAEQNFRQEIYVGRIPPLPYFSF